MSLFFKTIQSFWRFLSVCKQNVLLDIEQYFINYMKHQPEEITDEELQEEGLLSSKILNLTQTLPTHTCLEALTRLSQSLYVSQQLTLGRSFLKNNTNELLCPTTKLQLKITYSQKLEQKNSSIFKSKDSVNISAIQQSKIASSTKRKQKLDSPTQKRSKLNRSSNKKSRLESLTSSKQKKQKQKISYSSYYSQIKPKRMHSSAPVGSQSTFEGARLFAIVKKKSKTKYQVSETMDQEQAKSYRANFQNKMQSQQNEQNLVAELPFISFWTFDGLGIVEMANGKKYEGEWVQGTLLSPAAISYPSGSKYWGQVYNLHKHGRGELKCANGERYVGEFCSGDFHGEGILFDSKGIIIYQGEWRRGKRHEI